MTNRQVLKDAVRAVFPPTSILTRALLLSILDLIIDFFSGSGIGLDSQDLTVVAGNADGQLASNQGVAMEFRGYLEVKKNGTAIPTWRGFGAVATFPAYFCVGTSSTPRANGTVQMGDTLRWNTSVAGPLLDGDLITIVAATGVQLPEDGDPGSAFVVASDFATVDAASSGPKMRWIAYDNGTDNPVIYCYFPRVGRQEIWSFAPTTPIQ